MFGEGGAGGPAPGMPPVASPTETQPANPPATPPSTPPAATPDSGTEMTDDTLVQFKVDGEVVSRRWGDVKGDLSKVAGADKKFREASEQKQVAQRGLELIELTNELKQGVDDPDEMVKKLDRYYELSGYSPEEREPIVSQVAEIAKQQAAGNTPTPDPDAPPAPPQMTPEQKRQAEWIQKQQLREKRAAMDTEVNNKIDSDPVYATLSTDDKNADMLKNFRGLVHREVQRSVLAREVPFGPEAIESALQWAKDLTGIGKSNGGSRPNGPTATPTPFPSLGPAPGAPAAVFTPEPAPDRIPCTEAGHAENFQQRLTRAAYEDAQARGEVE